MEDLYKHIESLGKEHGYKNMTVLCKAAGVPRSTMSELNNGRSKDLSKPNAQKFADILGVTLDEEANQTRGENKVISTPDSKVTVAIVPTNEELAICQETAALVQK